MSITARPTDPALPADGLDALLRPQSVALIGASGDPGKIGGRMLKLLIDHGFRGAIHPVNPGRERVQGLAAIASIEDLPDGVDLAVVALPAKAVVDAIEQLGARGVRAAIVLSSGFGELGPEGRTREQKLAESAHRHGMRLLGPNCQGAVHLHAQMAATFATCFVERPLRPGPLALVCQSGAVAQMAYNMLDDYAAGLAAWISTGNEADLDVWSVLAGLLPDRQVRANLVYLEGLKSLDALQTVARRALDLGKPVIALQPGRSRAAAKAALTHTGALVSSLRVMDAVFARYAIIRAETMTDFAALGAMAALEKPPPGPRIAILTNSGGLGVMCIDDGEAEGLVPAELSSETIAALKSHLPGFAAVANPVDVTAQLVQDRSLLYKALAALADDDGVDIIIAAIGVAGAGYDLDMIEASLVAAQKAAGKLVAVLWVGAVKGFARRLNAAGVPCFEDPALGLRAIGRLTRYHRSREGVLADLAARDRETPRDAAATLSGAEGILDEQAGKALIARYGVPVVPERQAGSADAAAEAATAIGYPVAIKILSEEIAHKTEVGGVFLGVANEPGAREAFERIAAITRDRLGSEASPRAIVQPMLPDGIELSLGLTRDPAIGQAVVLGAGGRLVELLDDTEILLHPVLRADVERALGSLRVGRLLEGYRGAPPVDTDPLIDAVMAFARFVAAEGACLAEVDVNPLIVAPGGAVHAVDALVITKDPKA